MFRALAAAPSLYLSVQWEPRFLQDNRCWKRISHRRSGSSDRAISGIRMRRLAAFRSGERMNLTGEKLWLT